MNLSSLSSAVQLRSIISWKGPVQKNSKSDGGYAIYIKYLWVRNWIVFVFTTIAWRPHYFAEVHAAARLNIHSIKIKFRPIENSFLALEIHFPFSCSMYLVSTHVPRSRLPHFHFSCKNITRKSQDIPLVITQISSEGTRWRVTYAARHLKWGIDLAIHRANPTRKRTDRLRTP